MCGSATHPGGGIMGAPGRIASQVILKDWTKSSKSSRSNSAKFSPNSHSAPRIPEPPAELAVPSSTPIEKN
jgi:hypothetical protein